MNKNKKNLHYLINPLEYIAGLQALAIGFVLLVLGIFAAFLLNTRFDGVLNVHFGDSVSLYTAASDFSINFICATVCLYASAYVFGAKQTRLIDIAAAFLLAYAPLTLVPLLNIHNAGFNFGLSIQNGAALTTTHYLLLFLMIVLIPLVLIWTVTILFKSYKTATNLKNPKLVISFLIGLITSLVASKYLTTLNLFTQ